MKYPFDIVSIVRKKTFSIEARFSQETEESPLKVFDDTFSRYVFTVIADGKAATSNIPLDIIEEVDKITAFAYNKQLESKYSPAKDGETGNSPAYTVRFRAGKVKGKTPVDILRENPAGEAKKILNDQYKWLKENLEKYPSNKEIMDAIVEASKIDPETISESAKDVTPPVTILEIGTRPLVRKKREDGKCFCYECRVTWDMSKNYPVSVVIDNYYAPVVKKENGMLNVQLSGKDRSTEVIHEFSMTAGEWLNTVSQMKNIKENFVRMYMADAFKLAERGDRERREEAKEHASQTQAQTQEKEIA